MFNKPRLNTAQFSSPPYILTYIQMVMKGAFDNEQKLGKVSPLQLLTYLGRAPSAACGQRRNLHSPGEALPTRTIHALLLRACAQFIFLTRSFSRRFMGEITSWWCYLAACWFSTPWHSVIFYKSGIIYELIRLRIQTFDSINDYFGRTNVT